MTNCGHAAISIFDAAQELQSVHVNSIEHGGQGIDIEAYITGTDGENVLDFAGAVVAATAKVVVESCELCDGVVDRFSEGWRCLKFVSQNGTTIPLSVKVAGPREDEEWSQEDWDTAEDVGLAHWYARGLRESLRR